MYSEKLEQIIRGPQISPAARFSFKGMDGACGEIKGDRGEGGGAAAGQPSLCPGCRLQPDSTDVGGVA
jgi:hypothetical protein